MEPMSLNSPLAWTDEIYELQDLLADYTDTIYLVGGVVRDAYFRRPLQDIDLITTGSGRKLARFIANHQNGAYFSLDDERDVGRAILTVPTGKMLIDVSKIRGEDLEADLLDRDFTLNALAVDLRQLDSVYQVHEGLRDLVEKRLRLCRPNALLNDPIRVIRGVRQSVQFGLRIEPDTLAQLRKAVSHIRQASPERVRDEVFKLLNLPRVTTALRVAKAVGVIEQLFPQSQSSSDTNLLSWDQLVSWQERLSELLATISPNRTDETAAQFSLGMVVFSLDRYRTKLQSHFLTAWADERSHRALLVFSLLMLNLEPSDLEEFFALWRLSNPERDRLRLIYRHRGSFLALSGTDRLSLHRYWRKTGVAGIDIVILDLAHHLTTSGLVISQDEWVRLVEQAQTVLGVYFDQYDELVEPPALLSGHDIMRHFSIKAGPILGKLLDAVREAQVQQLIKTPNDALTYLSQQIDQTQMNGNHSQNT